MWPLWFIIDLLPKYNEKQRLGSNFHLTKSRNSHWFWRSELWKSSSSGSRHSWASPLLAAIADLLLIISYLVLSQHEERIRNRYSIWLWVNQSTISECHLPSSPSLPLPSHKTPVVEDLLGGAIHYAGAKKPSDHNVWQWFVYYT